MTVTPYSELERRRRVLQAELAKIDAMIAADVQPERVIWNAAKLHKTTSADVLRQNRSRGASDARKMVAGYLRGQGWRPDDIANVLNRDRSTVYYLLESHDDLYASSDGYCRTYSQLVELQNIEI